MASRQFKSEVSPLLTPMAVRIVLIERALRAGRPTFERLQRATGASRATLKRDLLLMRTSLGAAIHYDAGSKGYSLSQPWVGVAAVLARSLGTA
jgi:hypothetical protein